MFGILDLRLRRSTPFGKSIDMNANSYDRVGSFYYVHLERKTHGSFEQLQISKKNSLSLLEQEKVQKQILSLNVQSQKNKEPETQ